MRLRAGFCSQAVSRPVWTYTIAVCTVKTPDDGQGNCPKHVEFYSKNKSENLVHLVGFIIRIYHDARPPERQIQLLYPLIHALSMALKCIFSLNNARMQVCLLRGSQ